VAGPRRILTGFPWPPTLNAGNVTVGRSVTVNLTRIYTRLGDGGETHLGDMSRVPKTHPRIEAYGTVDELNAQLGVALALPDLPERFARFLKRIQNDLFDVGADISVPHGDRERLRVVPEQTAWLEQACDEVNAELAPLKSFVLPGGSAAAAQLHVCRTVCRRAERRTIDCGDDVNAECVRYLNRLSDLLFILARAANDGDEPLWEPGRYR
jgi:cob(I)alamin adenosyltransferase